ncbi:hypothetical protein OP471_000317 [Salmonella enterica subsp. enterica]|nr:hypothetical protein [Salmonella enterica]EHM1701857.1 hypothetical protein [Salmonella enterica subsp. enterica serovar Newport]EKC7513666.1 hypothetical protein [Salmonella enterica subsp. enterica]EAQ0861396.1 hypothetical protein [Salmonella enterica]EAR1689198.1 hypothetical protein [Salmonella enterica]
MSKAKITTNIDKVRKDLKKWNERAGSKFHKDLGAAVMSERVRLQKKIDTSLDRPIRFTQNAVNSQHFMNRGDKSKHRLFIMKHQAEYLKYYFEGGEVKKFTPVDDSKVNKHGNIKQLKAKRYKVAKAGNKTILIDPKMIGKKKGKRLVAVMKENDREAVLGSWNQNEKEIKKNIKRRMGKSLTRSIKFV